MRNLSRLALFALVLASSSSAFADGGPQDRTFGLGLQLGEPLGITGKVFFTRHVALAFGLGSIEPYGGFGGWADLDIHFIYFHTRRDDLLKMSIYAGPGIMIGWAGSYYYDNYYHAYVGPAYGPFGGPAEVTVHGPVGFAIHWQRVPFDTYAELSPGITFVPVQGGGAFFSFGGAIGGRYYF